MAGPTRGRKFLVTIEVDEDGWFIAECPALPGCVSQGASKAEAIADIREAIRGCLETRKVNDIPSSVETVQVELP